MEERIIIKLKDEKKKKKLKLIRKSNINLTKLICEWLMNYEIKEK